MRFDITEILDKGYELGLDPSAVMTMALYFVSNEGKQKHFQVSVAGSDFDLKVTDNMEVVFNKLMKDKKYYAFYTALKFATKVSKRV